MIAFCFIFFLSLYSGTFEQKCIINQLVYWLFNIRGDMQYNMRCVDVLSLPMYTVYTVVHGTKSIKGKWTIVWNQFLTESYKLNIVFFIEKKNYILLKDGQIWLVFFRGFLLILLILFNLHSFLKLVFNVFKSGIIVRVNMLLFFKLIVLNFRFFILFSRTRQPY